MTPARRIAVIGSGVAGLTAAHVAAKTAEVTLFEADSRLGGHADTHEVDGLAIDTGFIVHNRRTYPTLMRLFDELGVATQPSEMSMSVRDEVAGLEYAGALGARGLFPTWRNLARPRFLRMLTEVPRFHRRARALLDGPAEVDTHDQTLRDFLAEGRFSSYFTRHFMEPLVAAVWSCDPEVALDYPARYLFAFLSHHGMLSITGSPEWRTVVGGSREYVAKLAAGLPDVRLGTKVTSVRETPTGVELTDGNGQVTSYDAAVIATHPDQALAMLETPTAGQREALVALPYSENPALLHTDESLLPRQPRARASWNFQRPRVARGGVTVTYDLTRLQRLPTQTRYLVTLGAGDGVASLVDPDRVIARMEYAHPLYTPESVAAQRRLPEANTDRLAFAGAYHGWGFHEDGARSGAAAAEHLGLVWPDHRAAEQTRVPETGMFDTRIRHVRRRPFQRSFDNRAHTWLVDLDDLPDHGVLGRFEGRDHLGSPERSIRANVDAFLSDQGVDVAGGRVLMAANARALGYCFNPISVFWCFDRDDVPAGVIVEVHNTYGDRHAYLVHPDERGRARVDKELYVSPFHGTDGWYDLSVPVPVDDLLVAVSLHTDDGATFSVTQTGRRTTTSALRAAPQAIRGAVQIRSEGVRLWVRRLPIQPRPDHHQKGVR
ncbi:MAG: uncharacterized protein QOH37_680 [Nocardioidaceae bacterium]|nr:uncharacterized protein [Nocardioidaceae bacterium]